MDDDFPYDVSVAFECDTQSVDPEAIRHAVCAVLARLRCPAAAISVAVVEDDRIAALNKQFLDHDGPTDVLSFNLGTNGALEGEVVLSIDTARRESTARGHSLTAEVLLYVVHGTLHLLGFDDLAAADEQRMRAEQDRILAELGYPGVFGADES